VGIGPGHDCGLTPHRPPGGLPPAAGLRKRALKPKLQSAAGVTLRQCGGGSEVLFVSRSQAKINFILEKC